MAFSYKMDKEGDLTILEMSGRLVDKSEAVDINAEVEEELASGTAFFIIDVEHLEYMNSTGLNIMINIMNRSKNNGGEAVIVGAKPRIKSLFVVTKLNSVFTMKENRQEAMAYFNTKSSTEK
ncbi:MAG TPA: STAS domain-containing protein [Cryomorphaceae bacterium]|nr:STAS domain-containing protein [Cryomorphaceae bacterium]